MRWFVLLLLPALCGCGYVGDPLPPALNIPARITDVRAIQLGDRIVVQFTVPSLTTEDLPVTKIGIAEVRIGSIPPPFELDRWAASAKPITTAATGPGAVRVETPSREFAGQEVIVAARVSSSRGRFSDWSNVAAVTVVNPLSVPMNTKAESHPEGIRLIWQAEGRTGVKYRIFRDSPKQKETELVATVEATELIDRTAAPGAAYSYSIQAVLDSAESERSEPISITPTDVSAPAVPSGLNAVAGLNTIELGWERNTEADLRGYRVYRAEAAGAVSALAGPIETPAYTDQQVTGGKVYHYAVTAIDQSGNESGQSQAVEIKAP